MGFATSGGILIKTSSGFQKVKSLEGTGITFSKSGSKGSLTVTGGGSGIITAFADQGDNRIVTSTASVNEIQGEANLTWNGSNLGVTGSITGTGTIGTTGRIISGVASAGAILDYTSGVGGKPFTVVTGNAVKFSVSDTGDVAGESVTATGAVEGGSLTDGTATLSSGALASATTVTASGAITGGTLTDGAFSVNSGAVTGATTIVAGTSITTGTADDGVIVTPTTFKLRAGEADKLSVTATGAITSAAAIEGTSLTDGTATLSSGALASATTVTASGAIEGGSLTDGTATLSSGALASATTVTASGAITGGTLTDGAFSVNSGAVTGATSITTGTANDGVIVTPTTFKLRAGEADKLSVAVSGALTSAAAIQGASLTDGTATVSSGAITGATNITASGATTTGTAVVGSDSSATNSVIFPLTVTHTSTGTPAAGLGVGIAFKSDYADHNASAESNEVASIEAVATNVGAGAELFDLVFKARNGAAPSEKMRITATGQLKNITEIRAGTTLVVDAGGSGSHTGTGTIIRDTGITFVESNNNKLIISSAGAVTAAAAIQGLSLTDGSATISGGSLTGATNVTATGTVSSATVTATGTVSGAAVTASGAVTGGSLTDGTATVTGGAISGATDIAASGLLSLTSTGAGINMPNGQAGLARITAIEQAVGVGGSGSGSSCSTDVFTSGFGGGIILAPDDNPQIYTAGFAGFDLDPADGVNTVEALFNELDPSLTGGVSVIYNHSVDCTETRQLGRQMMLVAKGGAITVRNEYIDEAGPVLPDASGTGINPVYTIGTFNLNGTLNNTGFTLAANKACTLIITSKNGGNNSKAMVHVFGDVTGL